MSNRLEGSVQISLIRMAPSTVPPVSIRLRDSRSQEIVELFMNEEDLTMALLGAGYQPCEYLLRRPLDARLGSPPGLEEALNSGDGSYKP